MHVTEGFGKKLLSSVRDYAVPIYWPTPSVGQYETNHGTAFILDCGKGPFVVTAAHVYEAYLSGQAQHSHIRARLGCLPFRMEYRVIGHLWAKTLDIVTFSIAAEEVDALANIDGRRVLEANTTGWPPLKAKTTEKALLIGFPGGQKRASVGGPSFGFYVILTPIL